MSNGIENTEDAVPRTWSWHFWQKLISRCTSCTLTAWGVVTTTAPTVEAKVSSLILDFKCSTIDMCSSEVPGGVSITNLTDKINTCPGDRF